MFCHRGLHFLTADRELGVLRLWQPFTACSFPLHVITCSSSPSCMAVEGSCFLQGYFLLPLGSMRRGKRIKHLFSCGTSLVSTSTLLINSGVQHYSCSQRKQILSHLLHMQFFKPWVQNLQQSAGSSCYSVSTLVEGESSQKSLPVNQKN